MNQNFSLDHVKYIFRIWWTHPQIDQENSVKFWQKSTSRFSFLPIKDLLLQELFSYPKQPENRTDCKNDANGPSGVICEDWQELWGNHQTSSSWRVGWGPGQVSLIFQGSSSDVIITLMWHLLFLLSLHLPHKSSKRRKKSSKSI